MRILSVSPYPAAHGPIPKVVALLNGALTGIGHDISTVYWGRRAEGEGWVEKGSGRLTDLLRVARAAFAQKPDVIVLNTSHEWRALVRDVPLLLVLRPASSCLVVHYHGTQPEKLRDSGQWFIRLATRTLMTIADGLLVLCRHERVLFSAFKPGVPCKIVMNPYEPPPEEGDCGTRVADAQEALRLLFVGRVIRSKGPLDLVEALGLLPEGVEVSLRVIGEGKRLDDLRERTKALGLAETVQIEGYLEGAALADAYRQADVLVLPTYWGEGFPTVIAEAMGHGLAVVTTPVRGARDYLEQGVNALFVPPRAPAAIASAIARLADDRALCDQMGHANRRLVLMFEPASVARAYAETLREICAAAGSSGAAS